MRHLDEPFAAFGSVFSVARFRIVCADTSQLLMEQEVIPYRQTFHDYCREAMRDLLARRDGWRDEQIERLARLETPSGHGRERTSHEQRWEERRWARFQ
jgi:hypothetical protein